MPDPRLSRLSDHAGHRVYAVDGERVRNEVEVDFTMGGTRARWPFIPDGEIWVDACLSEFDRQATIRHEAEEYRQMTARGLRYEEAHDLANAVERRYRRRYASG